MGGSEAVLPSSVSRTTRGQITWFFLNRIIDGEEREQRVHLRCLAKLNEIRCEVCGEVVTAIIEYADALSGKSYAPREYLEHQLNMSEDEKELRRRAFTEVLRKHNEKKAAKAEA